MYGQGKYPHQFRHPSQQSQTNPPPPPTFQQAPTGPPLPPHLLNQPLSGPPLQYQHGLSYFPHSSQLYMPTLPLMQGNSSIPPPYSQPNMSYSSQHLYQPTPPRIFPPPPPPLHLQGQVLYQTPPPPPPGIQHVPAPPPPHPSGFASVTPAPFTLHGQSTTGDACPPSLPSPPPPPPPPPSPPPPLPPSPPPPSFPAAEFPGILKAIYPDAYGNFSASVSPNDNEADKSMNKDPQLKAENLEDLHLSPPKPLDEEALKMGGSSQYGKFDEGSVDSLSVSDMDMEDDVSHPDADMAAGDLGKESASEAVYFDNKIQAVADTFPAPMSTTNQLAPESLSSGTLSYTKAGTLSYTGSIHFQDDGVDGKVSPFLEDVSPVRNTPNAAEETQDNGQGSVGLPIEGSSQVNVSSTPVGCGTMETPGVYVKDGSPFRLIQGYDSDDSEKADGRENDHETITYALFGALGYMAFGSETRDIITTNFGGGLVTVLVQLGLCVNLFFTFPIMMHPVYEVAERWACGKSYCLWLRWAIVVAVSLVAIGVPNFADFLSLVGSSVCCVLAFVLPALFHLKVLGPDLSWAAAGADVAIILIGAVFAVSGTWSSLREIFFPVDV